MPQTFRKYSGATKDYQIDWLTWLGTDTIEASTWVVPTGITKDSDTFTADKVTIWLKGGTEGEEYILTNTIVTAGGRTEIDTITIDMIWVTIPEYMFVLVRRLRRMVAELGTETFTDSVLVEHIEQYPLEDIQGEAPTIEDTDSGEFIVNPDWIPTYDLNAAAAEIWDQKAGAIAGNFDFTADGGSYHRSQAVKAYENRARHYRSRRAITTITQRPEPLKHGTEEELDD